MMPASVLEVVLAVRCLRKTYISGHGVQDVSFDVAGETVPPRSERCGEDHDGQVCGRAHAAGLRLDLCARGRAGHPPRRPGHGAGP